MQIVKKQKEDYPKIGAKAKYPFAELKEGYCLEIKITDKNPKRQANRIRSALRGYKIYNELDWTTSVEIEGDKICVYRFKTESHGR